MSGEVVDSNPYSRLMALQRMGIVKDYEAIRNKTVRQGRRGARYGRQARSTLHCAVADSASACLPAALALSANPPHTYTLAPPGAGGGGWHGRRGQRGCRDDA